MAKLTIIAHIEAQPEKIDYIKQELLKLIEPTRSAEGCVQYDLHQDLENPALFVFYENWENKAVWEHHINSDDLQKFLKIAEDSVATLTIHQMNRIA